MAHPTPKNPLQFDTIYQTLRRILGDYDEIAGLAYHICHEPIKTPLYQIIETLLENNIHIHRLLSAISACEAKRLQYAFDSTKALPIEAQFASAKKIINDFNEIQDVLLATADTYFDSLLHKTQCDISSLQMDTGNRSMTPNPDEPKSYQQTIADSIKTWKTKKTLSIRNYYHGITIRAVAHFIAEENEVIQIKLNDEVARIFAIHTSENDAFAVCEGEMVQVRLSIEKVENDSIFLSLGKTFPIYSEQRKHLNIQVQEQIPVTIKMGRKRQLHARLHDLSIGGIGINVYGINQAPYNIGDKVDCQVTLNGNAIDLSGTVRWTGNSDDEARIGIELQKSSHAQHMIQKEVFRMQRSIINTINQLPLPEFLQQGLTH